MDTPHWWEEGGGYYTPEYYEGETGAAARKVVSGQVDFFELGCSLPRGARILDVGCGAGQVAIEMARRGYRAIGIDINSAFLALARRDAKKADVLVRFLKGDVRLLPFGAEFDFVFGVGPVLGQFSDHGDDQRALSEMVRVLRPGGFVLIEQWVRHPGDLSKKARCWEEKDSQGRTTTMTSWGDRAAGRIYITFDGGPDRRRVTINYRKYSKSELLGMFILAGARKRRACWLDFWQFVSVPRKDAWRLIVVGEK